MKKKLIVVLSILILIMAVFTFIFSVPSSDVDFRGLIKSIDKYDNYWAISVLDSTDTNYTKTIYIDTKTKILSANDESIPLSEIDEGIFVDVTFRKKSEQTIADKVKIFSPEN